MYRELLLVDKAPESAAGREPAVLLVATPFAAPASVKHTTKLIACLAPSCGRLFVVGDRRIDMAGQPPHIGRAAALPTLHYLAGARPWPALLWALKLLWFCARSTWAVVELRRQFELAVFFQGPYYAPALLCARLLGKRTLVFLPNSDADLAATAYRGRRGAGLLVSALRLLQRANRALAHVCAVESLALVDQLGLRPASYKARLANLYVDAERYRADTPLALRPPVVGFIGRLAPGKGIPQLLEAAAALRESGIAFQIIGDGPLYGEVERALLRPELAHVDLLGWAGEAATIARLNQLRLLILPSESEGLPNIVLEALACETPVLATAVGGIPDVVQHQATGFILPDTAPATIAREIQAALARPDLAAIAGRGRRHVLRSYALPASARKWRAILDELLESTASEVTKL